MSRPAGSAIGDGVGYNTLVSSSHEIHRLEQIGINALPALEEVHLDGWLARFANGHTGRANSVYPLDPGMRDVQRKIEECERFYAERSLPCLFKMTCACHPADLDAILERRGYDAFNHSIVQCADVRKVVRQPAPDSESLIASDHPTDEWFTVFSMLRDLAPRHAATLRSMLAKLKLPSRYVLIVEDEGPVACGLAVREKDHVGLFDITTDPRHQRRGLATRVVGALLEWAVGGGATTAYLQVMADNAAAISLYRKFGFADRYAYWYRRQLK